MVCPTGNHAMRPSNYPPASTGFIPKSHALVSAPSRPLKPRHKRSVYTTSARPRGVSLPSTTFHSSYPLIKSRHSLHTCCRGGSLAIAMTSTVGATGWVSVAMLAAACAALTLANSSKSAAFSLETRSTSADNAARRNFSYER